MSLVLTAEQMRAVDRAAIDGLGVPGIVLMENAGRAVAEAVLRLDAVKEGQSGSATVRAAKMIFVVCGAGQNGGDGLVAARHLANRGFAVRVVLVAPRAKVGGDADVFARILEALGTVPIEDASADASEASWGARLGDAAVIVDAIFGTGLRAGGVGGAATAAIRAMNAAPAARVAVDLPSGLDADTGRPHGDCVRADVTVTMGCAKLGLLVDADAPVGRIEVADLGIPVEALAAAAAGKGPLCHLLDEADLAPLVPRRRAGAHKGSAGHLLVVAGSPGKTGAALLAARAALRGGAGLATIASTKSGQDALDAKVVEIMTISYSDGDDAGPDSFARIAEAAGRMNAAVVGPGIPTGPGMRALVARLVAELPVPLLVDADALNLLGPDIAEATRVAPAARILTPHPGEMARLLGGSSASVQADRLAHARQLASTTRAVVALKGARTIVALPDGTAFVNPSADPTLATAGSGDVLAGFIGALAAQGLTSADATCLGVFVHGIAGGVAAETVGSRAIVAGDLPEAIARTVERILRAHPAPAGGLG